MREKCPEDNDIGAMQERCKKLEVIYSGLGFVLVPEIGFPILRTNYLVTTTRCPIMVIMRLCGLGSSEEYTEFWGRRGKGNDQDTPNGIQTKGGCMTLSLRPLLEADMRIYAETSL
jgi:hypothetical protein